MYQCKYCNKVCGKNGLASHERRCDKNPSFIAEFFNCQYCNKTCNGVQALHKHERHCLKNPTRVPQKVPSINTEAVAGECRFCQRVCKNANSLRNHERLCKQNPDRVLPPRVTENLDYSKFGWSKGLTKDTDPRVANMAEKLKESYASGKNIARSGFIHTEEEKIHLSDIAKEQHYETHFGRKRVFEYNGYKFISSYEMEVAKSLDSHNIKWTQPKRVPYKDLAGKLHYYTPDLYLPDYDIYLEPKNDYLINNINPKLGYRDIDKIKWAEDYNKIKVLLLNKDQLTWEVINQLIKELTQALFGGLV